MTTNLSFAKTENLCKRSPQTFYVEYTNEKKLTNTFTFLPHTKLPTRKTFTTQHIFVFPSHLAHYLSPTS